MNLSLITATTKKKRKKVHIVTETPLQAECQSMTTLQILSLERITYMLKSKKEIIEDMWTPFFTFVKKIDITFWILKST